MDRSHLSTRLTLTRDLRNLQSNIAELGEKCCQGWSLCISALSLASPIFEGQIDQLHSEINQLSEQTEGSAYLILSLQQPLLKDLRLVVGTLKIASQFTRITGYSKRLILLSQLIGNQETIPPELLTLAENCQSMLRDVLTAFKDGATEMALELVRKDKENDLLHDTCFQKIITNLQANRRQDLIERDAHLLSCIRFLERSGDAIAMIAKEVYFIYSGKKI